MDHEPGGSEGRNQPGGSFVVDPHHVEIQKHRADPPLPQSTRFTYQPARCSGVGLPTPVFFVSDRLLESTPIFTRNDRIRQRAAVGHTVASEDVFPARTRPGR